MSKLWITRGLPASGKSTWSNEMVAEDFDNTIRINRDTLRLMAHNGEFVKGVTEAKILMARNALVEKFLKVGMTVIVDDTNLARRNVVDLIKLAQKHGAEWEIKDFTDVAVDVCLQRDYDRMSQVGPDVILNQYNRYLKSKPPLDLSDLNQGQVSFEKYVRSNPWEKPFGYIVDIDGTVALMDGKRSPYDYSTVGGDIPNTAVIEVIQCLADSGAWILFTSGRPESCREDTEAWLEKYVDVPNWSLFMRTTGDTRADYIAKGELFDKYIRNDYNVLGVFDDRKQVVEMWRRIGLTCFAVDEGDF